MNGSFYVTVTVTVKSGMCIEILIYNTFRYFIIDYPIYFYT